MNIFTKKCLLLLTLLIIGKYASAQIIFSETFDPQLPGWNLVVPTGVNGADPNFWTVSSDENGMAPPNCGQAGGGNQTLHITSVFNPTGGASYDAGGLCGLLFCPETAVRAEGPAFSSVGFSNLTLTFDYIANGQPGVDFATVQYKDGGGWQTLSTLIAPTCISGQGQWTSFSMALPASCDNLANLQIGFNWVNNDDGAGTDPSVAINNVVVSAPVTGNSVTTGAANPSVYCAGSTITIPFTSTGTWTAGNTFNLVLSDVAGSFAAPTLLGSITQTSNNGTITGTIPANTPPGTGYLVAVAGSTPATAGTAGPTIITVSAPVTPTVTISGTPIPTCSGTPITFTAVTTNGGNSPNFQWTVNGTNSGTNSSTFTSATFNDGDIVTVNLTSNAACATPASVVSNSDTVHLVASVLPTIVINTPQTGICPGNPVTFTSVITNGGAGPVYDWFVNGVSTGSAGTTFTTTTLAPGDVVTCNLVSNDPCASPTNATSNGITMTTGGANVPTIAINALTSTTICVGVTVDFDATITFGGPNPVYAWMVNGLPAGTNTSTFTATGLSANAVVSCMLTSDDPCAAPTTANSNSVNVTVTSGTLTPTITISANDTTVCSGSTVNFGAIALNAGSTPSYQWMVNGVNTGTNSPAFSSSTLANNDVVTCMVSAIDPCLNTVTATSPGITMVVTPSITTSVTISSTATTFCSGTNVTFTATPIGGGTAPLFQWMINGSPVGTNAPTFSSTTFNNGDMVTCSLSNTTECALPATAVSTPITLTVNPSVNSSIVISTPVLTFCPPVTSITFTSAFTNGGNTPVYQWYVDGVPTGSNSGTFVLNNPTDTSTVTCMLIPSLACTNPDTAYSNPVTVIVYPPYTPVIVTDTLTGGLSVNPCASCSYQWNNINGPISGANSPTFQPTTGGYYSVMVTDPNNCKYTSATVLSHVGLENVPLTDLVNVFPNPATDYINLAADPFILEMMDVRIYDISGKLMQIRKGSIMAEGAITFDISEYQSGVYFISLKTSMSSAVMKFIKQ